MQCTSYTLNHVCHLFLCLFLAVPWKLKMLYIAGLAESCDIEGYWFLVILLYEELCRVVAGRVVW